MGFVLKAATALVALYVLIVFAAWLGQRKLLYFPDTQRTSPTAVGLAGVEEVEIATGDGNTVRAWHGRARPGQPTLLYFHGNAGSFPARAERIAAYLARGRGMFMMTYRGFGGSTGSPSEAANVADALRAYDTLVARGVAPRDILLYGESLGSGVAVQVAAQRTVRGIILDAPYTSTVDVGAAAYPYLPVRWLMSDRYETKTHIANVKVPLLIVHGDQDRVIPVSMGRAVYQLASEPKQLVILRGAGHANHAQFGSLDAVQAWIDDVLAGGPKEARRVDLR